MSSELGPALRHVSVTTLGQWGQGGEEERGKRGLWLTIA